MSNIKDISCKLAGDNFTSIDSLDLSRRYGHVIMVTLAYMKGWTVVRLCGLTVTKTKFSHTDGLPYFLTNGAPRASEEFR